MVCMSICTAVICTHLVFDNFVVLYHVRMIRNRMLYGFQFVFAPLPPGHVPEGDLITRRVT